MAETHMTTPLRDYCVLADGHRAAVVGPDGDWVWLCAPGWADDAVLSRLVGGRGNYRVTPVERFVAGGAYLSRSLVWEHRWTTDSGWVESREALALPADPDRVVGLRRLRASEATEVDAALDLRAAFGAEPMRVSCRDGVWEGTSGGLHLRWTGAPEARLDGEGVLRARLRVGPDASRDLVLEIGRTRAGRLADPEELWRRTDARWRESVPRVDLPVAARDATQAVAVMTGLSRPGGGMVAAATMALPEKARSGRSFDYRYAWVRDQCYAGLAAASVGALGLMDGAVGFVTARLLEDGDRLRPAYTASGGAVPDERPLPLPGYPGGRDVVGNWVNGQFQLDALGEALQLLAAAAARDRLDHDGWEAVQVATKAVESRWDEPDAGVWELPPRWWTHSRLACVAGLRAVAPHAPVAVRTRLTDLSEGLLAETTQRCLGPSGAWRRAVDDERPDAALLMPPVRGALPRGDSRTRATLRQVRSDLTRDGYVYRYRHGDSPLGHTEGAFLLCGFAMALAELHEGDRAAASGWFERTRATVGPPGLMTEEVDVRRRQLKGNLPQAFVHALLLETAAALSAA